MIGNIATYQILDNISGPGKRLWIYFQGCKKNCIGCKATAFQKVLGENNCDDVIFEIENIIKTEQLDGITISGGEPFLQPDLLEAIIDLYSKYKKKANNIVVYTGYLFENIKDVYSNVFEKIDVLIDGEYNETLDDNSSPIKGSINQRIIFFNNQAKAVFEKYLVDNKKRKQIILYNTKLKKFMSFGV